MIPFPQSVMDAGTAVRRSWTRPFRLPDGLWRIRQPDGKYFGVYEADTRTECQSFIDAAVLRAQLRALVDEIYSRFITQTGDPLSAVRLTGDALVNMAVFDPSRVDALADAGPEANKDGGG